MGLQHTHTYCTAAVDLSVSSNACSLRTYEIDKYDLQQTTAVSDGSYSSTAVTAVVAVSDGIRVWVSSFGEKSKVTAAIVLYLDLLCPRALANLPWSLADAQQHRPIPTISSAREGKAQPACRQSQAWIGTKAAADGFVSPCMRSYASPPPTPPWPPQYPAVVPPR